MAPELQWRKSSYSGDNGACVEIADLPNAAVAVRDSKDLDGPRLRFDGAAWIGFLANIERGKFDG
ncbi:DUF397 domain-containing protein [Streptomyces lunaelactis]|uniref:DUF397 domain-containing protein n=1 Tax=Streptomyces lunaelactis TaxID=1535768 RepID=UPI001584C15B|nr:DUF397 domain-containing protein [Streptomyces lunaelactis]NUK86721.1 DUF397 domain-containing protein [Streptomyces lunaelactis]